MWLHGLLVGFLSCINFVYPFEGDGIDPEGDWDSDSFKLGSFDGGERSLPQVRSSSSDSTSVRQPLPASVRIPAALLYKELFKPEKGGRPVPPLVKKILLPEPVTPTKRSFTGPKTVEVMCFLDRMHVRVLKSLFTNPNARKILKLGTCHVNKFSGTHYHLIYFLKECGVQREEDADRVIYSNTLIYKPADTGVIIRELPFTMDIRCSYAKFHRSYTAGFLPHIAGGTLFKGLTRKAPLLAAMDDSWKLLPVGQSFVLGKPICFEAKGVSSRPGKRLYLNTCFVTATQNPMSTDKYSLVENYGCLVDSKNSDLTKFYTSANKMTVRLCVAAFLFKNMASKPPFKKTMYMHCELGLGSETPTPSAKSCTYNAQTKKWTELYGDSSVCNCCASTCPASPRAAGNSMVTSESWDLKIGKEASPSASPDEPLPEFPADDRDFELFWDSDGL
ncbi:zona pellucida sperm-binding protein 3 [Pseudorasbora parva]|uniref:zona pellucida sperm-binding protein 3 n=1 Tax=Pseudorasbora parva TaxID=51549 RepID=UPI00351E1B6D